ncbi:alpha/beta fold hydrolase [Gilvimarinus sp. DA14]|uniref:alpha/beta fold hydrolase n=1 Tax=Gilvimarinus sp. DA14 TaxID=2956798 RepID=UPI0020B6C485|nr:alpha/beta hydrolase [Gilvimarinus sp. DA14]UTF58798.1 alpha/beta hydrolase [Gilvimarinus sp. DA14]
MKRLLIAVLMTLGFIVSVAVGSANAADKRFDVKVTGEGPAMIMIPGLNTPGKVWNELADHYQSQYQVHVLTLHGFAGAALKSEPSLAAVKDDLLAYISEQQLDAPVLVGHSLGGFLSLWAASEKPAAAGSLVIVDSLPFFPLVFNPGASEDNMASMAKQQTQGIAGADEQGRRQYYQQSIPGLVEDKDDVERVVAWSMTSDPAMTAQSMYEMMTTDLRDDLAAIDVPTLVLGSWYSAKTFGGTMESVAEHMQQQYEQLDGVEITLHESARHFIMLDDAQWTMARMDEFLQ